MMPPENQEDFSAEAETRRLRQVAEEALGLKLDEIVRSGSAANIAGIQSHQILFSQRLDSRTYFVQDAGYGIDREAGVFEGSDEEILETSRAVLERLTIPRAEIGEELVLKEQTQVAEVDQAKGTARLEEVQEGKKFARLSRQLDGLPVWSSNLILGLTRAKQIGFMQLHWPEIPDHVIAEAKKLRYQVEQGWRPPEQPGATVESIEAGIVHSPALGFVMDIYPTIRVIYEPVDKAFGKKLTLYLDRHGNNIPIPRQADLLQEAPKPPRPAGKTTEGDQREKTRAQFRALLLANPNYFGNLKESAFQPALSIQLDTTYEEIACVGFHPQVNQLEAVVYINQSSGYSGSVCASGSPEYVRFYLSFDNGASWQDQGVTNFTAYDIPGDKPLEYAVTLHIDPTKQFCFNENLPLVRAILSWNALPPANMPNFIPVWGNVVEARIQIDALQLIPIGDLFQLVQVKLPEEYLAALDLTQPVATAKAKALSIAELQELYQEKDVPAHRFGFVEVQKLIAQPELTASFMAPGFAGLLSELGIDFASLIDKLLQTDGDTSFEELNCVGLDPNLNTLVGVLTVKLPNGYSGGLCSGGSLEYVAFWVDWGDGAGWTYITTTSVNVHDIGTIPAEGLHYAVFAPVDLTSHQQPCELGPKTAKVRAILSWQTPPPSSNPDYVPTWGNREETLIHIKPGPVVIPGEYRPHIESVGSVAICNINQTTGMAPGEKPFGAVISITGFITNPPDVLATPVKYRVSVRELPPPPISPGPWQSLTNSFGISIIEQIGGSLPVGYDTTQAIDPVDGFYNYREDPNPLGGGWRLVKNRLLAQWITATPMTDLWEIKLEAKDPASGTIFAAATILCPIDGSTRSTVKVLLDEVVPVPSIAITGFSHGGGPVQPAVNCGTFQQGDVIHGTYSVTDEHFGSLTLTVEPVAPAHGAAVNPPSRAYPIVPTTGEAGTWTLDTGPMDPCGYIVRLRVADRTIVSGDGSGWKDDISVGFCLEALPPPT